MIRHGLDWNDLRFFLAVAQAGTVSGAARHLQVDHATVIRRVDALERSSGRRLFERTPRGYGLTQSGEHLLETARRISNEVERFQASGDNSNVDGAVRICCLEGFGNYYLAHILPEIKARYPRVKMDLITIQQIVALSSREADITITVTPPKSDQFSKEKLTSYLLYVYGNSDYLAKNSVVCPEDLERCAFTGYIDELVFTRGLDYLSEISPRLRADLQSSSLHAQMEFAAAGYGLCVLPAFVARRRSDLVAVLPEEIAIKRQYWLVVNDAEATVASRAVARFIKAKVRDDVAIFLSC